MFRAKRKKIIENVQSVVSEKYNHLVNEILEYKVKLDSMSRKEFAQKYAKILEVFSLVIKSDGTEKNAEALVKAYLEKQFQKEKRACECLGFEF